MIEQDTITYKIIGCAMKSAQYSRQRLPAGRQGFQEVIYQRCLKIEFERAGLNFGREVAQEIYYEERKVGKRRADFIVENKVIVELKAVITLEDAHLAQAKNYVVAYNYPKGLLINFGAVSLQYKLIFNPRFNPTADKHPQSCSS